MRQIFKQKWILGIFSCILAVLLSTTAFAQVEGQGSNILQMGGSIVVPANQTVENAIAVGGNVTVKSGARVEGDAYAVGGRVIIEPGATIK